MNRNVLEEVKSVIIKATNLHHIKAESMNESTTLGPEGLNLDSIDILEVVLAIEQHFKIKIENSEEGKAHFRTLGTIAQFIEQQKPGV